MKDEFPAVGSSPDLHPSSLIPHPFPPLLVIVAAVVALVIFVFPLLIRFPLLDPDEGLHAGIAQEMVERGDWITPRFLGEPFFDKPVLYCWVEAASLWLLGPNEAAVRLPGLMFGLLGAMTTGLLGWRMFSRTAGLIAGILYATTILPTALAQAASHDVALVPWINLSLLLLWESHRGGTPTHRNGGGLRVATCTLGAGFFLGLSILTKGLEGATVVGLAYGGWLLITWRASWAALIRGVAVLAVAALVAAPWYLAVEWQNPGYLSYYFVNRHLLGFTTPTQRHGDQPWWYYLPILLGGGLPWIGYLPVVMWRERRGAKSEGRGKRGEGRGLGTSVPSEETQKSEVRGQNRKFPSSLCPLPSSLSPFPLLWCWPIGWLVLLSFARSKLATYLWPAFPPMAILAAVAWTRFIAGTLGPSARRAFAQTFVWSSWSGPVLLPAAVWIVQSLLDVRLLVAGLAGRGRGGRDGPVAVDPLACGLAAGEPGGRGALDGRAVRGGDDDGAPAGGRVLFRPRPSLVFQPGRPTPAAVVAGGAAGRLAHVLPRPAAPRRTEARPSPAALGRPAGAAGSGGRGCRAETRPLSRRPAA